MSQPATRHETHQAPSANPGPWLELEIPGRSPSLNEILRWTRKARSRHQHQLNHDTAMLARHQLRQRIPDRPTAGRQRVELISHRSRPLDLDNLAGGLKPHLDALTAAQLIRDDSPGAVDVRYSQHSPSAPERVVIRVWHASQTSP